MTTPVKRRTKQCMFCETAIERGPERWIHTWSGQAECINVVTRKKKDSFATPRPDK